MQIHLAPRKSKTCLNKLFIKLFSRGLTGPSCDLCFENYIELKYLQVNTSCIFIACPFFFFLIYIFLGVYVDSSRMTCLSWRYETEAQIMKFIPPLIGCKSMSTVWADSLLCTVAGWGSSFAGMACEMASSFKIAKIVFKGSRLV